MSDLKEQFEQELKKVEAKTILSPEYKKKKLLVYCIRTIIAVVIFYFLWDHEWIKWALWLYIPLNLFSLLSIFGWNYLLNKKLDKARAKISELDNLDLDEEE